MRIRLKYVLVVVGWLIASSLQAQEPLRIHMISGSKEYKSEASLKAYRQYLKNRYPVHITASWVSDGAKDLPGVEHVPTADVLLVFARRMKLPEDQAEVLKRHWKQGNPVVGIRTASHAFRKRTNKVFDQQVLGGNYQGHFDNQQVAVENAAAEHPVLNGVAAFSSRKMYKAGKLAPQTTVLQKGTITGGHTHPVTWVHIYNGGRMFYTSLGTPEDFKNENFLRLLTNAIFWTTERL